MDSPKEKVSYCIGYQTGQSLVGQFPDTDVELLLQGVRDGFTCVDPILSTTEMKAVLIDLKKHVEQQQKEYFDKIAEDNKREGEEFLVENRTKDDVVTLMSGLQYRVISSGCGKIPNSQNVIKLNYQGKFIDGTVFASSYKSGKPLVAPVNRLIPGWVEACQLMKEGDKWELFVPHYLAYGPAGFGNEIGPNSTLIFELELLEIVS